MFAECVIKDKKAWDQAIEKFTQKDVYFTYNYFVPFKNNGDGEPILYCFGCDHGKVAYPFMLRDIAECENLKGEIEKDAFFDISSAYGYGGPLYDCRTGTGNLLELKKAFFKAFSNYCEKENIISQFDRFHPLIKNHDFFKGYSELLPIRKTVCMDLRDVEKLWANLDSKCRNKIRKARKNGVSIVLGDILDTVEDFKSIYNSTMDKHKATDYYYFYDRFFNDTVETLAENVFIANAYFESKIIASSLIMKYNNYLHYHFSGALREYRKLPANNLLLYKVAKWGNENGYEKFHLGGGYESETDSLYKFKKSFSKLKDKDFYIGKKIHDVKMYDRLTKIAEKRKPVDSLFFPAYRE